MRRRLVASPAYLKARGKPETPKDLRHHECLVHGDISTTTIWRFGKEGGSSAPVAVRGRVSASNSEAVLQLARGGLGIALLADWLVAGDVKKHRLVVLLSDFEPPPAPVYALSPQGKYGTTAVRALIDYLADALAGARLDLDSLPV